MNKYRIFLLFSVFLFFYNSFSQVSSGIVTYKITPISLVKDDSSYFKELQLKKMKFSNFIEYKLKFNNKISVFYLEKILNDEARIKTIRLFDVGKIFILNGFKIRQKQQYGTDFIIKSNMLDVKWKISNETKKIGKYICHKATTVKKIINPVGVFYRDITAWYCPKLPIPFGPMGYGNLPGLILELKIDKKGIYSVKDIVLSEKQIEINEPNKGERVSEKEFIEIGKKMYERRRNGL